MNMVDLFAITPFYLTLALDSMEDLTIIGKAGKLIRLVRVLRIMRIFKLARVLKLARHSPGWWHRI